MKKKNRHTKSKKGNGIILPMAKVLQELSYGPATRTELLEVSGLSQSTLRRWLRAFREVGFVRVCGFEGRGRLTVFELNPEGKGDYRYEPKTRAQIVAQWAMNNRRRRLALKMAALACQTAAEGSPAKAPNAEQAARVAPEVENGA